MPPKKREKDMESSKNPRIDHMQADHELFLQAFEKPTQIYRYLRTRHMCSPIFLYRTLTYMKYRMSRPYNKQRQTFKIDSLLDRITKIKHEQDSQIHSSTIQQGYINITFLAFNDKSLLNDYTTTNNNTINSSSSTSSSCGSGQQQQQLLVAQVEATLLKISHKKRKESSAPSMQVPLGTADIPINPHEQQLPPTAPTISISTESFNNNGGNSSTSQQSAGPLARSYKFLFRVTITSSTTMTTSSSSAAAALDKNCDDNIKKEENEKEEDESSLLGEPPASKQRRLNNSTSSSLAKTYCAELTVIDKFNRCYLADGDYDVVVQDLSTVGAKNSPKKHASWENGNDILETCGDTQNINFLMNSSDSVLKFKLTWSQEACARIVDRPKPYPYDNATNNKENIPLLVTNNNSTKEKMQIVYQFVYNNNSRQQTEACEDLHCPWCSINSDQLYTLLKHLKLCHSRFTFTYVPISIGARIDVAINELYDGSYTGSPHDLITQSAVCAFSRNGPVRRATVTHILVCHPKRRINNNNVLRNNSTSKISNNNSLSEFLLELEHDCGDYDGQQRPFITGHNRLYHHTTTCLPIYPKEMDVDSEGENDPEWLRNKTMMMIDEFTDVNEGEKELMKLWNLHIMKNGFVGDCQIPLACQLFVQYKGKELLLKNLYKNFVVHMTSLFDFGLVSAVCLYTTIQKLQELIDGGGGDTTSDNDDCAIRNVLKESRAAQLDCWSNNVVMNNYSDCISNNKTSLVVISSKTPTTTTTGRNKAGNIGSIMQRRKGTPQPAVVVEGGPSRRKSVGSVETSRKRLSLSLNKLEAKKQC